MGGVRWNEKQYNEYLQRQQAPAPKEARKAKQVASPVAREGGIVIEIPLELSPLVNGPKGLKRMHFQAYRRLLRAVSDCIKSQLPLNIPLPFERAKVEVIRYTAQEPDKDNLVSSVKPVLDALQPATEKRTYGTFVIVNDNSAHIDLDVRWEKCSPKLGKVIVLVTPI